MASRTTSWLTLASLFTVAVATGVSCGSEKQKPPSLSDSTTSGTSTTSVGTGGGGNGGAGGSAGAGGVGGNVLPSNCNDAIKDDDETDIDCGGSCAPCANDKNCLMNTDCASKNCSGGTCAKPSCSDTVQNQGESDVDCGGTFCPPCVAGDMCDSEKDCDSMVCKNGLCQEATCSDQVKNGAETDIDCGGGACPACHPGATCNGDQDCITHTCEFQAGGAICICPEGMLPIPIGSGSNYCIDTTEVTYAQYKLFYSASPVGLLPNGCEPKADTNFTPDDNWPPPLDPASHDNYPVTDVTWCDAYAYCKYNGKHLCGKISGGPNAPADYKDELKSEWYNACSAQNTNTYPYAGAYKPQKCNGIDYDHGDAGLPAGPHPLPVSGQSQDGKEFAPECQGGAPNLRQMSGNIAEWEDSCDGDNETGNLGNHCLLRGGSFNSDEAGLKCAAQDLSRTRNYSAPDVGFRCCL